MVLRGGSSSREPQSLIGRISHMVVPFREKFHVGGCLVLGTLDLVIPYWEMFYFGHRFVLSEVVAIPSFHYAKCNSFQLSKEITLIVYISCYTIDQSIFILC